MKAYVIYLNDQPLEWQLDRATRYAVGHDCTLFYGFPDKSDAKRVLREVPFLFDLDEEDAQRARGVRACRFPRRVSGPGRPDCISYRSLGGLDDEGHLAFRRSGGRCTHASMSAPGVNEGGRGTK